MFTVCLYVRFLFFCTSQIIHYYIYKNVVIRIITVYKNYFGAPARML